MDIILPSLLLLFLIPFLPHEKSLVVLGQSQQFKDQYDPYQRIYPIFPESVLSCKKTSFRDCMRTCTRPEYTEKVWERNRQDEIRQLMKDAHEAEEEDGEVSCLAACMNMPYQTSCQSACSLRIEGITRCIGDVDREAFADDEGRLLPAYVGKCPKRDPRNPSYWKTTSCMQCLQDVAADPEICPHIYPDRGRICASIMENCTNDVTIASIQELEDCVSVRQMEQDAGAFLTFPDAQGTTNLTEPLKKGHPCYIAPLGRVNESAACDDFILKFVPKKPCIDTCALESKCLENPVAECMGDCKVKAPFTCKEGCTSKFLCIDNCQKGAYDAVAPWSFLFFKCYSRCLQTPVKKVDVVFDVNELQKQCVAETFDKVKEYANSVGRRDDVFPLTSPDEAQYALLLKRRTVEEIMELCKNDPAPPLSACITNAIDQDLSPSDIEDLCRENPFRRYLLVMWAAALSRSLETTEIRNAFLTYYYDPSLTTTVPDFVDFIAGSQPNCENTTCQNNDPAVLDQFKNDNSVCRERCILYEPRLFALNCQDESEKNREQVVVLATFSQCTWKVDLSLTDTPDQLTSVYFNEKAAFDEKVKLTKPNTQQYLQEVTLLNDEKERVTGFFVFPYFLVIRGVCESGYYDDPLYRLVTQGVYPSIRVSYLPSSFRDPIPHLFAGTFRGALVNLTRDTFDVNVPMNPAFLMAGRSFAGCRRNVCYPGYVVPQIVYRMPQFEVSVEARDVFASFKQRIYVAAYHNRETEGSINSLIITNATSDVRSAAIPSMYFPLPLTKVDRWDDSDVYVYEKCVEDCKFNLFGQTDCCPELLTSVKYGQQVLDSDDFLTPQFTYGSSPIALFAGFYDPSLIIIGDPDMNKFELSTWTLNSPSHNISIFSGEMYIPDPNNPGGLVPIPTKFRCWGPDGFKARGFRKLIYSLTDYSDKLYPITYYRVRYHPRSYEDGRPTPGIFDAVSLEDRLLLVTPRGLVTFYGNINSTRSTPFIFKAPVEDYREACFKFVRTGRQTGYLNDLVVGITYDYEHGNRRVHQEIHVGVSSGQGKHLDWHVIKSPNVDSEVERICNQTYTKVMAGDSRYVSIEKSSLPGQEQKWCQALDAAPLIMRPNTFLLLIRMELTLTAPPKNKLYFYILAAHTLRTSSENPIQWEIVNVIPRIPCIYEHYEAVKDVYTYFRGSDYFSRRNVIDDNAPGCHNIYANEYQKHIYLERISPPRTYNNYLFLYGSTLLQSPDGGKSLSHLVTFPDDSVTINAGNKGTHNRIKVMAFDDSGHYAFLTTRRELWYGSTGDIVQIKLRPSPAYSIMQTYVSNVGDFHEGVPFSVFFDSNGQLHEMVAVLNEDKTVEHILKRKVPVGQILRLCKFLDGLDVWAKKVKDIANQPPPVPPTPRPIPIDHILYNSSKWALYCPYTSSSRSENYSESLSRTHRYFLTPPLQHPLYGTAMGNSALWAFQAASFTLTWNLIYQQQYSPFSNDNTEPDPFKRWVKEKQGTSDIGLLRFLRGNPEQDGVLVIPESYKRLKTGKQSDMLYRVYYLDISEVIRFELVYTAKYDSILGRRDYFTQIISRLQINMDNPNGSLIRMDTERIPMGSSASVKFIIDIGVKQDKDLGIPQSLSGQNLIPNTVLFHLLGGFGNCVSQVSEATMGGSHSTIVFVGCRPSIDLLLNWNKTINSTIFKNRDYNFGLGREGECYNDEYFCFFAREPMTLFFDIYDHSTESYHPYTGNYVLKVIGGGYTKDTIIEYSKEQIDAFNIPGVSDVSLIWNAWDRDTNQRKVRPPLSFDYDKTVLDDITQTYREVVLKSGLSAIEWSCRTLSPCARIVPNAGMDTVFWFRIHISNRDVENKTFCLFERTFDIMFYGFPPSPEVQLITTIGFAITLVGIMYLIFICTRRHKRVWRSTENKMFLWFQIVKDTLPKSLTKTAELDQPSKQKTQQEKDAILLSLQGKLKTPHFIAQEQYMGGVERGSKSSSFSSTSLSLGSHSSRNVSPNPSEDHILDAPLRRAEPLTLTDLVYEQIIAKRLAAIVERNKRMRYNLLQRLSEDELTDAELQYEQEEHSKSQTSLSVGRVSAFSGEAESVFRSRTLPEPGKKRHQRSKSK